MKKKRAVNYFVSTQPIKVVYLLLRGKCQGYGTAFLFRKLNFSRKMRYILHKKNFVKNKKRNIHKTTIDKQNFDYYGIKKLKQVFNIKKHLKM